MDSSCPPEPEQPRTELRDRTEDTRKVRPTSGQGLDPFGDTRTSQANAWTASTTKPGTTGVLALSCCLAGLERSGCPLAPSSGTKGLGQSTHACGLGVSRALLDWPALAPLLLRRPVLRSCLGVRLLPFGRNKVRNVQGARRGPDETNDTPPNETATSTVGHRAADPRVSVVQANGVPLALDFNA